ncbi:MAG: hypothetical protein JWR80_322 [Bradyrhizobium sp.]|nr:hypothetical protein [Bradyrhizobium sp.]
MTLSVVVLIALVAGYFVWRRNRDCRILSAILHSRPHMRACQRHREELARSAEEHKFADDPEVPPPPLDEATGETIRLHMVVERTDNLGSVVLRCSDRSDPLSYWSGTFMLTENAVANFSQNQRVAVEGIVADVDPLMRAIKLTPAQVDRHSIGHIRLTQI